MTSCIEMGRGEDVGERIVIHVDNKLISVLRKRSQIFMKLLRDSPFQCKKLLFLRMVSLLGLVHGSASISRQRWR